MTTDTDAVHRRGCSREGVVPSRLLPSYVYCPTCARLVREEDAS